jgi:hypothetical protein
VSFDPVLRFKDSCGNDYVGVELVDVETLEELLGSALDLIDSPPVYEELTEHVSRTRVEHLVGDLANRLSFVRHLVGPGR